LTVQSSIVWHGDGLAHKESGHNANGAGFAARYVADRSVTGEGS
jgi:hypothetical protein